MGGTKRAVNACVWLIRRRAKIKALHPQQMQGKRKARPFLTGWNASYLDALNSAEKNQKKNRMQEKITLKPPHIRRAGNFRELYRYQRRALAAHRVK